MRLSIRWKVTLGSLLAVTCGLAVAGLLAMQSLEQQEITQLNDVLDARTNLVEYSLRSAVAAPLSQEQQTHLRDVVRQLGTRALARVTLVTADGTVIADSAVDDAGLSAVENHLSRPARDEIYAPAARPALAPCIARSERSCAMKASRLSCASACR
jgi:two-component system phosphate regulon sensor histidine kinase PhoR